MTRQAILRSAVLSAGLDDLWDPVVRGARLGRGNLARVRDCGHPLAAAALADLSRERASGVTVTHPWTLRIRAPGTPWDAEDETRVSHRVDALDGIPATEAQIVGNLPTDLGLGLAVEMVRSVKAARDDLTLRAFTTDTIDAIAAHDGSDAAHALGELRAAGLDTLDWAPGSGTTPRDAIVHRLAHELGYETVAPLGYARNGVDDAFLDRIDGLRDVAEATGRFVSVVVLPGLTEGASPLQGTAGTEDVLACALARLALGHTVHRLTIDAHVVGHKLGAVLLACGADDFVGAQAAAAWAPPTSDGPRPLNPDRVRRFVVEARRSPTPRDALFRPATPGTGA